ncbi:MAG: ACP S-malonyltransferase, partial [Acidobacteriota bacterium]
DVASVEAGCAEAAEGQICSPANINSTAQVVIAGDTDAVDRACEILKAKGAKRAIKLNVSAPFHCALMMPAQERLALDLDDLEYGSFEFPVVHNVDAAVNADPGVVADRLKRQVSSPVRWLQSVEKLDRNGITTFVEIGPGKVLTGLTRQIDREAKSLNVENVESLRNTLESL